MKSQLYKNRYGDEFTFTPTEDGNILWEGNFQYCRSGWANDYTKAWEKFQRNYGGLSFEEFKEEVHKYDDENNKFIYDDIVPLITSKTDEINMIDPSGGPFIAKGMRSSLLHEDVQGKFVKEFIQKDDGWIIVLQE